MITQPVATGLSGWTTALVHEHRERLARVARREGLVPEDAFDVVHDAFQLFLTLPDAPQLVGDVEGSRKLLVALVRNLARNRRRRAEVARPHVVEADAPLADELPGAEALLIAAEDQARLGDCVRRLEDVQRAVVTLRMLDGASGDEVARILGITRGHVAVLLHRAKARLLACMSPAPGAHRKEPHGHARD